MKQLHFQLLGKNQRQSKEVKRDRERQVSRAITSGRTWKWMQMNFITKEKQAHRLRKEIDVYQERNVDGGRE